MNSAIFCLSLLFCISCSAQDYGNLTESYYCDTCELLKEFGALREKLTNVEGLLHVGEIRLSQCEIRQEASETRLGRIEKTLMYLEKRIDVLGKKVETQIIFSAATGGEGPIGPFNTDTPLPFERVITNIGEAFNQYTGIFTAPFAGVYYFIFFCHAGGNHPVQLYLYKNNELIVQTQDHWTLFDTADNGGNGAFLQLQPFDQVYVVMGENSHVWGSRYHTTFSGFLVTLT